MTERLSLEEKVPNYSEYNKCEGEEDIKNKIIAPFQNLENETTQEESEESIVFQNIPPKNANTKQKQKETILPNVYCYRKIFPESNEKKKKKRSFNQNILKRRIQNLKPRKNNNSSNRKDRLIRNKFKDTNMINISDTDSNYKFCNYHDSPLSCIPEKNEVLDLKPKITKLTNQEYQKMVNGLFKYRRFGLNMKDFSINIKAKKSSY